MSKSVTGLYADRCCLLLLLFFFFFLLLSFCPLSVNGQGTCVPWNSTLCEPFIPEGSWVFLPASGLTNTRLRYELQAYIEAFWGVIRVVVDDKACYSHLINAMCATILRPCVQYQNQTLALPVMPCRSLCASLLASCASTWGKLFLPSGVSTYLPRNTTFPLVCNVTDNEAQGNPLYPTVNATYTFIDPNNNNLTRLDVPCAEQDLNFTVARVCTDPLVLAPDESRCGFACPLPALSDSQYENAKIMQGIVGWTSWVASSSLIISYLVIPTLRKFPKNLILMVSIAANIASAAIILPSYAGYDNIWCGGEEQVVHPHVGITLNPTKTIVSFDEEQLVFGSSACTFQGAMLLFGFLSAVFWWAIIALNMCIELYLRRFVDILEQSKWKWLRFGIYLVVGWGLPFVFMVIPAAADRIKFASGATYCFVSPEEDKRYQLAFWFLPVGLSLVIGSGLFIFALVKLFVVSFMVSKGKMFLFLYYRLLLFIFIYLFLFTFIFSYNLQVEANSDEVNTGFESYYTCLVFAGTLGECSLDDSVSNYDLVMLKGFAISSLGFFVFITFISWDILRFWFLWAKKLIFLIIRRDRRSVQSFMHMFVSTRLSTGGDQTVATTAIPEGEEMDDELRREDEDEEEEEDGVRKCDDDEDEEDSRDSSANSSD